MDKKIYSKTRYQNIYRHKNGNYVVMMSKPVKTSISRIDGEKIWKIEDALNIRDNKKIKLQKGAEIKYKQGFDELWEDYIDYCKNIKKQAFNTHFKKQKIYNKDLKGKIDKPLNKLDKKFWVYFIDNIQTTDKQKNEILKVLKAFYTWCMEEEIVINNPLNFIKYYKVPKPEMKYWLPTDIKKYFNYLNNLIQTESNLNKIYVAYRTKIFVLLEFSLGDRVGETRALHFNDIIEDKEIIKIKHSINYDRNSNDFVSNTKTYQSQRDINISSKIIEEIKKYKHFLTDKIGYNVNDNDLLFFNYSTNKPFSDIALRKAFYSTIEKAEVPKIRMYDLRHTYVATMMAEEKELYLISERLGHTSYSTTVNKYGHLSNQIRKEVAEITDKYI